MIKNIFPLHLDIEILRTYLLTNKIEIDKSNVCFVVFISGAKDSLYKCSIIIP